MEGEIRKPSERNKVDGSADEKRVINKIRR